MRPISIYLSLLLLLLITGSPASGQTSDLYSYQELSHFFYRKQKDSLQRAWSCPASFKDKNIQKKYREIWNERTDFLLNAIADDDYVYDKEINAYINDIVSDIAGANKTYLPAQPLLILDRSPSVNAYALGSNVVAINLGLIAFAGSREEIAFTVAHELSHNILEHAENAMKKKAAWLASDEYKKSLEQVLDSKYERLTRLQKVLQSYSFDRSRHQRYREGEADSLAVILLKNAHIAFDPSFFLRLDSADLFYKQPLKQPVKNYFSAYQITIEDAWLMKRSKGLSTRNYNFQDRTLMQDSLKTHPDCAERYDRFKDQGGTAKTAVPVYIKDKATKMLIWNMYCNMPLAPCLYRVLMEKDNGNPDPWYDFMINNIMLELHHADKDLQRFSAIGVTPKEYISKGFYELQTLLEQLPREQLAISCKTLQSAAFWNNIPPPETAFKQLLQSVVLSSEAGNEQAIKAAKAFTNHYATSLYCEYAEKIKKQ
jgi:hypothetical protein